MKILSTTDSKGKKVLLSSSQSRGINKKNKSLPFSQLMTEQADESIVASIFQDPDTILSNITQLGEELDRAGADLADNPTPANFNQYKKFIRLLCKGALENYDIIQRTGRKKGSFLTQNVHYTSQAIDKALADLAEKLLHDEKNRLDLLNLTNHIKGLILDIVT